jgi:hypothetical protein
MKNPPYITTRKTDGLWTAYYIGSDRRCQYTDGKMILQSPSRQLVIQLVWEAINSQTLA